MGRIPSIFLLSSVALSFAASIRSGSAAAQNAPSDDPLTTVPPLLLRMVAAANARDGAAIAALYTEDGTHEDVPAGVVARGREEIAAFVDETLGQFRDVRLDPVFGRQAGDLAVLEYSHAFTDRETGQMVAYRGALVFELRGTLIRRSTDYYDLASILRQLGQPEADEAAPGATPAP